MNVYGPEGSRVLGQRSGSGLGASAREGEEGRLAAGSSMERMPWCSPHDQGAGEPYRRLPGSK